MRKERTRDKKTHSRQARYKQIQCTQMHICVQVVLHVGVCMNCICMCI